MRVQMKDGTTVSDQRLGRLAQFDDRSRQFPVRALLPPEAHRKPRSYTWSVNATLDQGQTSRCVEYSICHEMIARPAVVSQATVDTILAGAQIYYEAQRIDQWEGGEYPGANPVYGGTSVLAGIKVASDLGFYTAYDWAFGLEDLVKSLGYHGPAVLGVNWYDQMFWPDEYGWIRVDGGAAGGHAILARGVRLAFDGRLRTWDAVNMEMSYVLLHNSWGPQWGLNGSAKISLKDLDRLLREDGECCLPRKRVRR